MKKFVSPEISVADLTPVRSVMDDITSSSEFPKGDNEHTVPDPGSDEATW